MKSCEMQSSPFVLPFWSTHTQISCQCAVCNDSVAFCAAMSVSGCCLLLAACLSGHLTCCEGVHMRCCAAHISSSMLSAGEASLSCSGGSVPPGCRQPAVYVDPDETFSPRLDKRSTRLAAKVGLWQALSS